MGVYTTMSVALVTVSVETAANLPSFTQQILFVVQLDKTQVNIIRVFKSSNRL